MTSLVAKGLVKNLGGRLVVDSVDLCVNTGEVVGLLGPNGAGKTTAFKVILGLLDQEAGTVTFDRPLDGLPLHRRARLGLGYLPQGPSVFRGLTVEGNLLVLLETLKKPAPRKRAADLLRQFELTKLKDQKASTLSGGERRRLEFARALCSDPKILLVDEPFAGVDPMAADDIASAISRLAAHGVGILLTDHSVGNAMKICHRVYLLVDGRIVEEGTPEQIKVSDSAKRLYLGENYGV